MYTATVTGIAVGIGLVMVNLLQPGTHLDPALVTQAMPQYSLTSVGEIATSGSQLDFMSSSSTSCRTTSSPPAGMTS